MQGHVLRDNNKKVGAQQLETTDKEKHWSQGLATYSPAYKETGSNL